MRGSIIQRKNSKNYTIVLDLGRDENGKRRRQWIAAGTSKREAHKRLTELLHEMNMGNYVRPGKLTTGDYLQIWLTDYCKSYLSDRTHELYSYICEKHIAPTLGRVPLADLKPAHIQHLYADKMASGLSPRTVQITHVTLHKALKNAIKTGLLARNVADSVTAPRIERRSVRTMSEADVRLFLDYAKESEYYPLFYLALFTGMRRGELLALRWGDCDIDLLSQISVVRSLQYANGKLSFKTPKTTRSKRLVSLSPATAIMLREHRDKQEDLRQSLGLPPLADDDLVFSHFDGTPLLPNSVTHAWIKLVRRCDLTGIRLHDARHTHASLLLRQGTHPKVVQERLGHGSIQITLDLYSHVTPGMQQAAAARLDGIVAKPIHTAIG